MIGYKGFDKEFRCRGMQYEVGKTYHHDGKLKICQSGLHFCKNPNDIFPYYPPTNSRYALIEATGNIVEGDDKCCTDELTIVRELSLTELIEAIPEEYKTITKGARSVSASTGYRSVSASTGCRSVSASTGCRSVSASNEARSVSASTGDWSISTSKGDWSISISTGDCSISTSTGDRSISTSKGDWSISISTGDRSVSASTGDWSTSEVTSKHSLAVATGFKSVAKGALGCWLVLADWRDNEIADMQIFRVDGEHIKPDTFYRLKDGQLTEAHHD